RVLFALQSMLAGRIRERRAAAIDLVGLRQARPEQECCSAEYSHYLVHGGLRVQGVTRPHSRKACASTQASATAIQVHGLTRVFSIRISSARPTDRGNPPVRRQISADLAC